MSSRPCNYCTIEEMKKRYKGQTLHIVPNKRETGTVWYEVYFVPEGEQLDTRKDPITWNKLSDQWKMDALGIGKECAC